MFRAGASLLAASLTAALRFLRCFARWIVGCVEFCASCVVAARTLGGAASTLGEGVCPAVIDLVSRCALPAGASFVSTLGGACVRVGWIACRTAGSCAAARPASDSNCFSCRICSSLPLLLSALMLLMHAEIACIILSALETSGRVMRL